MTRKTACLLVLLVVLSASSAAFAAEEALLSLRLGVSGVEGETLPGAAEQFAGAMADASGGRVAVETRVDDRPNADVGLWDSLVTGSLDLALIEVREFGRRIPSLAFLGDPFLFPDSAAAERFYLGEGGRKLAELAAKRGIFVIGWIGPGSVQLLADRPLRTAEDFAGLRLVADENPLIGAAFRALGAETAAMPYAARLATAESGQADAMEAAPEAMLAEGLPASMRHVALTNHYFPFWAVCHTSNLDAKLSGDGAEAFSGALDSGVAAATEHVGMAEYRAMAALRKRDFEVGAPDRRALAELARAATEPLAAGGEPGLLEEVAEEASVVDMTDFGG